MLNLFQNKTFVCQLIQEIFQLKKCSSLHYRQPLSMRHRSQSLQIYNQWKPITAGHADSACAVSCGYALMRFGYPHRCAYISRICMISLQFHADMLLHKRIYFPNPHSVFRSFMDRIYAFFPHIGISAQTRGERIVF